MMQKRVLLFCTLFLCFGGVRADIFGDLLDFVFGGFGGGSNPPSQSPPPPPLVDPGNGARPVAVPAEYAYSPTEEYEYVDTPIPTPIGYPPPVQTPLPKPVLLPSPPPSPILLASPPPPPPPPSLVQSPPPPPPVADIIPDVAKPQENAPPVPRLPPPGNENYPPPVATVLIPDRQQGSSSSATTTTNSGMSTTTKIIIAVSCSVGGVIAIAIIIVLCCYCGQKRKVKHSQGHETDLESGRRTSNTSRRSSNKSRSRANSYKMNSFDPFMNEKNLPEVVRLENAGLQVAAPGLEHTSSTISRSDILKNGPGWKSNQTQSEVFSNAVGPMAAAAAAATTISSRAVSHQSTRKKRSHDAPSRDQTTDNNTVSQWLGISKAEEKSELTPNDSKSSLVSSYDIDFSSLELDVPVGQGSFGTIYKAMWNETLVAVKFLTSAVDEESCDPGNPNGGQIVSLLESEGEILASLRHPNIVQFIGVCSQPPCIVSEFVDNGSLSDLIRSSRASKDISWGMLLKMLTDAATGMLYLHARPSPIIHCDLKSNNILVDSFFRTKICDFNLSRLLEQSTSSLVSSVQNPRWIAPEVLDGERYSKESDVYSFGIVMWEVLTRKIPWHGVDMGEIVTLVREGARPEIPNFWDVQDGHGEEFIVFEEYVDLMTSCWSQNPYDRPSFAKIIKVLRDMTLLSGQQPIPDLKKNAPEMPDQAMLTNESTRAMTDSMPHRRDI